MLIIWCIVEFIFLPNIGAIICALIGLVQIILSIKAQRDARTI
jgi:hypothetical protein